MKEKYEELMIKAQAMMKIEATKVGYWIGYIRGLQRAYHGEKFCTAAEHEFYLKMVNDPDIDRRQTGKGYHKGLAALNKSCGPAISPRTYQRKG